MARRTRRIRLVQIVFVRSSVILLVKNQRESLIHYRLNEASRKCNKQNAYIGTQITEETYSKSSHVIARQLRSLDKKESHNSYALSNYEFKYSSYPSRIFLPFVIIKLR